MSHTLISLLGGSSQTERDKRYRKARYDFGSGPTDATEFFGLALSRHIMPDRLVILGTSGSMWDVLLESLGLADSHSEALLALIDSAAQNLTTQAQLDQLIPVVSTQLGLEVALRLIPYGRDANEQTEILARLAEGLAHGDSVSLDVTHGLRHLPILAQMSALYLRQTRKVTIRGVYYGALDMSQNGITPVMNLDGLLTLADWVEALYSFDKDGDYGVFAPLLKTQAPEQARRLTEAAFFERTLRVGEASGKLRAFLKQLDEQPLIGVAALFQQNLCDRIDWCQQDRHDQRQQTLARDYLANADYLRCALIAYEAFVTQLCRQQGIANPEKYENREAAEQHYKQQRPRPPEYKSYLRLRDLRNVLAHGSRPNQAEIQQALSDPTRLHSVLNELLDTLLPQQ